MLVWVSEPLESAVAVKFDDDEVRQRWCCGPCSPHEVHHVLSYAVHEINLRALVAVEHKLGSTVARGAEAVLCTHLILTGTYRVDAAWRPCNA